MVSNIGLATFVQVKINTGNKNCRFKLKAAQRAFKKLSSLITHLLIIRVRESERMSERMYNGIK